jgi:hypothetical protein
MVGDVSCSAAQNLPILKQHLGGFGLDLPGRQDEIDAMRRLPGGEVLGPERRRAASLERVVQSVPAMNSPNRALSRSTLKSPHTTAGTGILRTTRATAASWAR